MNFYGVRVYDMAESIVASGFPMLKKTYTPEEFEEEVKLVEFYVNNEVLHPAILRDVKRPIKELENDNCTDTYIRAIKHLKRIFKLGSALSGSGHDSANKGIIVNVNIKADQSFWLQFERYHYQDTISLIWAF